MKWYRCNICSYPYPETDLILDKDIGCICQRCVSSIKELDAEQEEIETMMRAEKKSKAGII